MNKKKVIIPLVTLSVLFPLSSMIRASELPIHQHQKELQDEYSHLMEIKSQLTSQLNSYKEQQDYLEKEKQEIDLEKKKEELTKLTKSINPLVLTEDLDSQLEKAKKDNVINTIKVEIINDSLQDSLGDFIEKGNKLTKLKKEIEELTKQVNEKTELSEKVNEELIKLTQFQMPAKGVYTSFFGWRRWPLEPSKMDWHTGIDIAGSGNIISALDGVVTISRFANGYGNYIEVDHGEINGVHLKTRYAHLSSRHVKVGDIVTRGQLIGIMGSTGNSTGVHLHFEVWENGVQVNPKPYLDKSIPY